MLEFLIMMFGEWLLCLDCTKRIYYPNVRCNCVHLSWEIIVWSSEVNWKVRFRLSVLSVIHELFPFDLLCIIHVCSTIMYFYKHSIHRCLTVVSERYLIIFCHRNCFFLSSVMRFAWCACGVSECVSQCRSWVLRVFGFWDCHWLKLYFVYPN